jgi:hypothetical protein
MDRSDLVEPFNRGVGTGGSVMSIDGQPIRRADVIGRAERRSIVLRQT